MRVSIADYALMPSGGWDKQRSALQRAWTFIRFGSHTATGHIMTTLFVQNRTNSKTCVSSLALNSMTFSPSGKKSLDNKARMPRMLQAPTKTISSTRLKFLVCPTTKCADKETARKFRVMFSESI